MKKIIIAVILAASSIVLWSCENDQEERVAPAETTTDVNEVDLAVVTSQLIAVRNEIGRRVMEHSDQWDQLEEAFANKDEATIKLILEITDEEERSLNFILEEARKKAPIPAEEFSNVSFACSSGCLPNAFESIKSNPERFEELFGMKVNRAPDGCNYYDYTVALLGCAGFGPYLYWICAYMAYCEFCYGPTHDEICEPLEQIDTWL